MLSDEMMEGRNPFGSCSLSMINIFESSSLISLPDDYKDYLLRYNGANFKKKNWGDKHRPFLDFSVAYFYGLHNGPIERRLDSNFRLYENKDLEMHKCDLFSFLVIGVGSMGVFVLIDLKSNAVCLFDPDAFEVCNPANVVDSVHKVAGSFEEFGRMLKSEEEYFNEVMSPSEQDEFTARLRKLRDQFENEP